MYIKRCLTIIFITVIFSGFVSYNTIVLTPDKCNGSINKYGIIDGYLSELQYNNIIYSSDAFSVQETHGDQLIKFSNCKNFSGEIFYYAAVDNNGKITNTSIIEGLEWMLKNNVYYVNISLSSKKYSEKLENWILEHPNVKIYCSYNNQENTFDYPALYEMTIASGSSKKINYKKNDVRYRTNLILIYNDGLHWFKGNSFLSLNTLLEKLEFN